MTTAVLPTLALPDDPARPRRARLRWTAARLASLAPRSALTPVLLMAGAIVCTSVDVALMEPAVARVLRHSVTLSWLTAAGIGLVALLAAGWAGWSWRGARGNHPGSPSALVLPVALLAGWAAGGIVVMRMRLTASGITTAVAYQGAAPSAAPTASFDTVAALAFLVVYLIVGTLAFSDFYERRNDAYTAGRGELVALEKVRADLGPAEATYQQLLIDATRRREEIRRVDDDAMMALGANEAFAAELKQLVRDEMATGWGDPRRTGVTSPRHPDNPHARRQQ